MTLCDGVSVNKVTPLSAKNSEQNSSLRLLWGAAVEVLRISPLGCSLDQVVWTRPCHVIGGDSDTSASFEVKRVQTIHRTVSTARGLALPLGVGTKVFQHELALTDWSNIHS
jgi:hypothetical protein